MSMGEQRYTVSYAVEEHNHREVDTVTVDLDSLPAGISGREQAVNLAAERSVYTHVETLSIAERDLVEAGSR